MNNYKANKNQRGFFIVEELIAGAVVLVSVLALSHIGIDSLRSAKKQREIATMIERENMILGSLQNIQVLSGIRSALTAGKTDNLLICNNIVVPGFTSGATSSAACGSTSAGGVNSKLVGQLGTTNTLSIDRITGDICQDPNGPDCTLRVDMAMKCTANSYVSIDTAQKGATVNFETCAAAYRIVSTSTTSGANGLLSSNSQLANLGALGKPGDAFNDNDFALPIAFQVTSRLPQDKCSSKDITDPNLFANGYDINTGKLYCTQRSDQACDRGQVASSVVFDKNDNSIHYDCKPLKQVTCPKNYVLQSVNIFSLRPTSPCANAVCVFVGAETGTWLVNPPPASSVSVKPCTKYYVVDQAECTLTNIRRVNGSCPYSCGCDSNGNNCSTCYQSVPPNEGTIVWGQQNGARTTSCHASNPDQSGRCGASWSAEVKLTGMCKRNPSVAEKYYPGGNSCAAKMNITSPATTPSAPTTVPTTTSAILNGDSTAPPPASGKGSNGG